MVDPTQRRILKSSHFELELCTFIDRTIPYCNPTLLLSGILTKDHF